MKMSWTLGTLFKIPVKLHISMLILPFFASGLIRSGSPLDWVIWLVSLILIFGSVLLHEFGHALTARRFGIATKDIILTPIGGIARAMGMPTNPKHEIAIAIAGPLVSFALGFLGVALSMIIPAPKELVFALDVKNFVLPADLFLLVGALNLMLGAFNLIPALPMDGGRVFRGLLALKYDHLKATTISARLGKAIAVIAGLTALFFLENSFNIILISIFIYMGANSELRMAQVREYQKRMAENGRGAGPFNVDSFSQTFTRRNAPTQPPPDTYSPYGRQPGPSPSGQQRMNSDWEPQPQQPNNGVIVVEGGKAEIISRKDPPKDKKS
jgi:Zn-dependent protease